MAATKRLTACSRGWSGAPGQAVVLSEATENKPLGGRWSKNRARGETPRAPRVSGWASTFCHKWQ
jgi:hypothetical protein